MANKEVFIEALKAISAEHWRVAITADKVSCEVLLVRDCDEDIRIISYEGNLDWACQEAVRQLRAKESSNAKNRTPINTSK